LISQPTFRYQMIHDYGHRCMLCGYKKIVVAHHLPFGVRNRDLVGILLCPNCHALVHSGSISLRRLLRARRKAARRSKGFIRRHPILVGAAAVVALVVALG